jgi:DNA-directed RNA polymerase subunit RPC12/RpoP
LTQNEDLVEKKVLGSNGYAFVNLTEEEALKFNLGVPELFFANIGRIDSKKFLKYYCNKCAKEYPGSPQIFYENPNEEVAEGVILTEKGEYKCMVCGNTMALYRKFNE